MREADLLPDFIEIPDHNQIAIAGVHDENSMERIAVPTHEVASQLLAQTSRPTAVFCFNDIVAMGVYKAARELGLCVPQDISLISVDNLPTVTHFEVPLTTFALPGAEIGRQGANLLLRRIAGEKMPTQQTALPAPMIQRASTAVLS
jgi:DNA-binding LacI/PurR family transcriptional regulator